MAKACAYRLKDRWLIHPSSKTTAGVFIACPPYQTIPASADVAAIGDAICLALAASRENIPHPTEWKGLSAPRLAAAGVRSEAALQRGSRLVLVERTENGITITPTNNGGTVGDREGFHHLNDHAGVADIGCSTERLGMMLNDILEKCS